MIYAIWGLAICVLAQFLWLMRIEEIMEENGFIYHEEEKCDDKI